MGRERKESASDTGVESLAGTITRGFMIVILTLGVTAAILILLALAGIKLSVGDFPPGFIMLFAAGFMLSVIAAWQLKRYQGQFVALGISLLTLAGVIWTIFEDGLMGKAFMFLFTITAGFMAALAFYNVFIRKRQPDMPG